MKIKSKSQFQDYIQSERKWRRQELHALKTMVRQSKGKQSDTVIRVSTVMLYSHWEGYVKSACQAFFTYMNHRAPKYSDLTDNLVALGIIGEFEGNFPAKKYSSYLTTTQFVTHGVTDKKFKLDIDKNVDTKSNLNIEVLNELLDKVGLDNTYFNSSKTHIDERLLKNRNAIAHGERTDNNPDYYLSKDDFLELSDKVDSLLDHLDSLLTNHLELETFLKGNAS